MFIHSAVRGELHALEYADVCGHPFEPKPLERRIETNQHCEPHDLILIALVGPSSRSGNASCSCGVRAQTENNARPVQHNILHTSHCESYPTQDGDGDWASACTRAHEHIHTVSDWVRYKLSTWRCSALAAEQPKAAESNNWIIDRNCATLDEYFTRGVVRDIFGVLACSLKRYPPDIVSLYARLSVYGCEADMYTVGPICIAANRAIRITKCPARAPIVTRASHTYNRTLG